MSLTFRLISIFYRATINSRTLEPRRGFFWILYYGIGIFTAFIVISMILICLEAYDLNFARDFLYQSLGQRVFPVLESLLF